MKTYNAIKRKPESTAVGTKKMSISKHIHSQSMILTSMGKFKKFD
jgi:hypothetical protein